jgi:hypothetical protein
MIKLDEPVAEFWLPQGDGKGNPLKAIVDHYIIGPRRIDPLSRIIEIGGIYGYLNAEGIFQPYIHDNTVDVEPETIKQGEYDDFVNAVSAKGAPAGDFRTSDLEDLVLAKGLVKGQRV